MHCNGIICCFSYSLLLVFGTKIMWHSSTSAVTVNDSNKPFDIKIYQPGYLGNVSRDSAKPHIYSFELVKPLPYFLLDFLLNGRRGKSFSYNITNMDGCAVLKSISSHKWIFQIFRHAVVDAKQFQCPFQAKVYFLREVISTYGAIPYYGAGSFKMEVNVKLNRQSKPIYGFVWQYTLRK